ncbi:hypothetical protein [Porphyromonas sp. COT-052 OH4946]|uniref:hypothetical protein n=1 Tax=Porphyromonas sp. COT-052 OH4946 TaxID=1515618 RepID=UPI001269C608|nr:hypothetical protein [Porphyromonas sp. COT-052 OH4946]
MEKSVATIQPPTSGRIEKGCIDNSNPPRLKLEFGLYDTPSYCHRSAFGKEPTPEAFERLTLL